MNKQINFILPLIIYPFDIMVSLGETNETLKKSIKKYAWEEKSRIELDDILYESNTIKGRTMMTSCNRTIIRMSNYPKTNEDFGELMHEIFHATTFVMDRIGMRLVLTESDEAYSYLHQYIVTEIFKRIK